jgi:hypothetical protein
VTKLQLSLTSLVAVIPAAYLVFLLVAVLLTDSQNLTTIAFVVLGVTLAAATATVLIPAAVWIGGRRQPKLQTAKVAPESVAEGSEDIEAIDDDIEALDDESGEVEDASDSYIAEEALGDSAEFDLGDSNEILVDDSEADMDTEPVDDFEDFDLEEEEEPKPKKKKK